MTKMVSNLTGVFLEGLATQLSSTKWSSYIEMKYRVFVRLHQDVQHQIDGVAKEFLDTWESHAITVKYPIEIGEVFDEYWPIRPEDIEKCERKKYLLTDYRDQKCVVVRELPIRIDISNIDPHVNISYMVEKACAEKFAVIKVVKEKTLEIQAW